MGAGPGAAPDDTGGFKGVVGTLWAVCADGPPTFTKTSSSYRARGWEAWPVAEARTRRWQV